VFRPTISVRRASSRFDSRAIGGRSLTGALEVHGSDVLLRSILVAADARGEDVGRKVVDWLLAYAGAGAFFEKLGFEIINRGRAPRSIMATRQAVGLCPVSATLLTRAVTASILEAEPLHQERKP
jgi:N-acetylglutamate synthase-like GNAT family acetyltransferase